MLTTARLTGYNIFSVITRFLPFIDSTMTSNKAEEVRRLFNRLQDAVQQVNTLHDEITDIKRQIGLLQRDEIFKNLTNDDDEADVGAESAPKRRRGGFMFEGDFLEVYTDGACENNGQMNAKAGIGVWFGFNNPMNVSKPVEGKATNNTAEIQACVEALRIARENGINKVKINTDSEFTINCMTKWIRNWKKRNWTLASGGPVKNKMDLEKLDVLCQGMVVKWNHVAGHRGIAGNEEADKLARAGALRYR